MYIFQQNVVQKKVFSTDMAEWNSSEGIKLPDQDYPVSKAIHTERMRCVNGAIFQ